MESLKGGALLKGKMDKLLISTSEVVKTLSIGKSKFYQMLAEGRIRVKPIQFGNRKLWPIEDIKRWVKLGCPPNRYQIEKVKKKRNQETTDLSDVYIKSLLCGNTNLKSKDLPIELVKAKKEHLKLKRLMKGIKNENNERSKGKVG